MSAIFHPTDLSPASAVAFRHALRLSLHEGASLTIMHVHGALQGDTPWGEFPAVRKTLDSWRMADRHLPKVRKIEAQGSRPDHVIEDYLDRHTTDLIVLAAHHREQLAALLKPSVSARVLRHAKLPALVIPEGSDGFVLPDGNIGLRSVLFPIAEEPDPQLGLDFAVGFLSRLTAMPEEVTLLHAGGSDIRHQPVPPRLEDVAINTVRSHASPAEAIVQTAGETGAGLIVMTSAGHDSLHDVLFGSTYEQVIQRVACPVLFIPAPDYSNVAPL